MAAAMLRHPFERPASGIRETRRHDRNGSAGFRSIAADIAATTYRHLHQLESIAR
jgi:hypothetical protein